MDQHKVNHDKKLQHKFVEEAMNGNIESVKEYISNGGNINSTDEMGLTALTAASQLGHTNIVEYLLLQNDKISKKSIEESFILACEFGFVDITRMLIDIGGVHVDTISNLIDVSDPGIVAASRGGSLPIVELLIQRGALVNNRGVKETHCRVYKSTALIEACDAGHFEIVKFLVKNGADLSLEANNGDTALMRAKAGKYVDIVEFLIQSGDCEKTRESGGIDLSSFGKLDKELANGPSDMAHGSISKCMLI
jgi:ankyrin repeat protein